MTVDAIQVSQFKKDLDLNRNQENILCELIDGLGRSRMIGVLRASKIMPPGGLRRSYRGHGGVRIIMDDGISNCPATLQTPRGVALNNYLKPLRMK